MITEPTIAAPIDLSGADMRDNPYPTYAWLRHNLPVARVVAPFFGQAWMVTRYDDVAAVLKDPRFSNDSRRRGDREPELVMKLMPRVFRALRVSMITLDDPDHARLRNLVHQAFTPRRIAQLRERVQEVTDDLLDSLERKGRADLVADFALLLPLTIISDMMGVPEVDRLNFHRWTSRFLEGPSSGMLQMAMQVPNGRRLLDFFDRLIAERRANPGDDLISALVLAEQDGDRLSEEELVSMIFLLLLAGHETTVNLIASGTLALLESPDQMRLLREQPELIGSAIEELLRYTNPVEYGNARFALEDVEIAGVVIPRGGTVLAMNASANRDEAVFDDPDRLDITREPNRHLAFGLGVHYCLGAPLARLEGQIAINSLVQRLPQLALAVEPSQVRWRNAVAVRGLRDLPVTTV